MEEDGSGFKITERNINNLCYANDTTLIAKGARDVQALVMLDKEHVKKMGLKINIQKTKSITTNRTTNLRIDNENINAKNFSYQQ